MLLNPRWGLAPPGFLLSLEPGQPGLLCGLERLRFSSPFQQLHRHSHQQAATVPNALAKAFVETLKTIPESPTGGRAIERHPGRAEGGVKPRCGDKNSVLEGNMEQVSARSVYALHSYFPQV